MSERVQWKLTERVRAEEALCQYTERLRTLRAIDGAILATWSSEKIAQTALRHIVRLLPCQVASVALFDLEVNEGTLLAVHTKDEPPSGEGTRFSLEGVEGIQELYQGQVRTIDDITTLPVPLLVSQAMPVERLRACIQAPLIAQGGLIGCLYLGAESPRAFTPDHVDVAHQIANQLALGMHQARLRAALEAEEQRLQALVAHLPDWYDIVCDQIS